MLFGKEHVRRYQETDGAEGYEWNGTSVLILTTTGRTSGEPRSTPLIYREHDGAYLIVASYGGADIAPNWYRNLAVDPRVRLQVLADRFDATARDATADEKPAMWRLMTEVWPAYDDYQRKTEREIPVVVLERT